MRNEQLLKKKRMRRRRRANLRCSEQRPSIENGRKTCETRGSAAQESNKGGPKKKKWKSLTRSTALPWRTSFVNRLLVCFWFTFASSIVLVFNVGYVFLFSKFRYTYLLFSFIFSCKYWWRTLAFLLKTFMKNSCILFGYLGTKYCRMWMVMSSYSRTLGPCTFFSCSVFSRENRWRTVALLSITSIKNSCTISAHLYTKYCWKWSEKKLRNWKRRKLNKLLL